MVTSHSSPSRSLLITIIMKNTITYLNTSELDRDKALLLVEASIQAYNILDKNNPSVCHSENVTPPFGYDLVECWTGVDAVFNEDKTVESYGIVFCSQQSPHTYIFAFRGTDSIEDLIDDFGANQTNFVPYQSNVSVPSEVRVESGFFRIYSDKDSSTQTKSMQQQLFALIDKYQKSDKPIDQLYITGHSLGAGVSQLFTLDVALSRPNIKASNYNYASPRVGNDKFVQFYEQQRPQQNPSWRTIRIQNIGDKVPCVPLEEEGYQHLSIAYLIDFHKDDWVDLDFIVDNHSVKNYQAVLKCAFNSKDGICVNHSLQVSGDDYTVKSEKPNPSLVCSPVPYVRKFLTAIETEQ